jgi:hypothetical protein
MSQIITFIKRLFTSPFKQNQFKIQTFTYFIPAPKPRKTGYREKQFDKLFYEFINLGYKIIDFKTQQCVSGQEASGMWVIFILQAKNAQAEVLNLDKFGLLHLENQNEDVISHTHSDTKDLVNAIEDAHNSESEKDTIDLPELSEEFSNEVKGLYQIKK